MAEKQGLWQFLDRISISYTLWDVITKLLLLIAPVGMWIYAALIGLQGPYIVLLVLGMVYLMLGIRHYSRHEYARPPHRSDIIQQSGAESSGRTAPCYNKSFYQLAGISNFERPLASLEELQHHTVEDRLIQLVDIPRDGAHQLVIYNKRFRRCTIVGPGMVYPLDSSMLNCSFLGPGPDNNLEALLWERNAGDYVTGPIQMNNCQFFDCEFVGIGVAGTANILNALRKAVTESRETYESLQKRAQ
jgi:hypothetical protein